MCISYGTVFTFALLINKASLQVVGVFGGSVVLQCASSEIDLPLSEITVHWRHNGSLIVYDIIEGKCSVEDQAPVYKNRAEPVFKEYKKGNFSIKLNNLMFTDAGDYQCFIIHSSKLVKEKLIVKEAEPIVKEETRQRIMTLISVVVFLISLFVIFLTRMINKKRG